MGRSPTQSRRLSETQLFLPFCLINSPAFLCLDVRSISKHSCTLAMNRAKLSCEIKEVPYPKLNQNFQGCFKPSVLAEALLQKLVELSIIYQIKSL